jgi:protein-S-isoprenylcysteine O-methyltransferase Ste14
MEITFIPQEEKNLEEQFGEKFEAYKKKVRRWL